MVREQHRGIGQLLVRQHDLRAVQRHQDVVRRLAGRQPRHHVRACYEVTEGRPVMVLHAYHERKRMHRDRIGSRLAVRIERHDQRNPDSSGNLQHNRHGLEDRVQLRQPVLLSEGLLRARIQFRTGSERYVRLRGVIQCAITLSSLWP